MNTPKVVNIKKKYLTPRNFDNFDHWNINPDHVYIGRSMTWVKGCTTAHKSKWANPFPAKKYGREKCVEMYEDYIIDSPELYDQLDELANKELGCWCAPEECHGDVLVRLFEEKMESKLE